MPLPPTTRAEGAHLQAAPLPGSSHKSAAGKPQKPTREASILMPLSSTAAAKPLVRAMPPPSAVLTASRSPPMSPSAQANDRTTPLETFALRVVNKSHNKPLPSPHDAKLLVISLPPRQRKVPMLKHADPSDSTDPSTRRNRRKQRHAANKRDQEGLNAGVYVLENAATGHKYFNTTWDLKNAAAQSVADLRDGVHPHVALVEAYAADANAVTFRVLEHVTPPSTDRRQRSDGEQFAVHTLESLLQQRLVYHTRQVVRKSALRLVRSRLVRPWLAAYWPTWRLNTLEQPQIIEHLAAAVVIQSVARMLLARCRVRRKRQQLAALRIARFFALCAFKRVFIKRRQRQLRHTAARCIQRSVVAFLAWRQRQKRQQAVHQWLCCRRIQRVFRGHVARRRVHQLRFEQQRRQAVIALQRLARGFLTRCRHQRLVCQRRRDASAAVIQSRWRGYYTRTVIQPMAQHSQRRLAAAQTLQRFYRRVVVRHNLTVAATQLQVQRQHASKIHTAYKNYLAHKFGWAAMAYRTEHASAVQIQRAMRRWVFFSRIRRLAAEHTQFQAARRIQSLVRGHQARRHVQALRRIQATTKIQRVWRLYKGFERLRRAIIQWQRDRSARRIQAAVRGYRARRVYRVFRDQARRERAATKLQTIYRASRTRRAWRRRMELHRSGRACPECGERAAAAFLGRVDLEMCIVCLGLYGASPSDDDVVPLALYRRQQRLAVQTQRVFRQFQQRMVETFGVCSLCESLAVRVACRSCYASSSGGRGRERGAVEAALYCHTCDALFHKPAGTAGHDRLRVELCVRQQQAAVTIQKHVRRFLHRHRLPELRLAKQTRAAERIQTVVRGRQQRRRTRAMVDARRQLQLKRMDAAMRIQRTVRAWLARRAVAERIKRRASATMIQRMVRGREGRRHAQQLRRRRDAAVCIQRCVRGAKGRTVAAERRRQVEEKRRAVAGRAIRRSLRRWISKRRKRVAAAMVIQRAWRGCSARIQVQRLRSARAERLRHEAEAREEERRRQAERRRHEAATKIQTAVRRRQARRRLALLRVARAATLRAEQLRLWLAAERRGAERIQRFVRRKWLNRASVASGKLQRAARGYLARTELKRRRICRRAAVQIQRAFRYARVKRRLTRLVSLESFVAERTEGTGGWVELLDEESGCVYYYHRETMASSWVKPADWVGEDAASAAARVEGGGEEQPEELQISEWVEYWDENVGAAYYYNTLTGEATWATPDGINTSGITTTSDNQSDGHPVWPPGAPVDKAVWGKAEGGETSNQVEEQAADPATAVYYDDQGNAYTYYEGYGYIPYGYSGGADEAASGGAATQWQEGFDQSPIDTSYNLNYEIFLTQQQQQEEDNSGGGGEHPFG